MNPSHLLLILASTVMAPDVAAEITSYTVYSCRPYWSPFMLRDSSESDDININIFHSAMSTELNLVENLEYNVTATSSSLTKATSAFVIVYLNNNDDHNTDLNHMLKDASFQLISIKCTYNNFGFLQLPFSFEWESPMVLSEPCAVFVSLISRPGTRLRSRPVKLCKATECNKYYTSQTGIVASPNYPETYPNDFDCKYTIIGTPGSSVSLQFQFFKVQPSVSGKCLDYVRVSLGDVEEEPMCGQMTSSRVSNLHYITASGFLTIRFHSDSSLGDIGFMAVYSTNDSALNRGFNNTTGSITSPNFPKFYPSNTNSITRIHLAENFRIIFKLAFLDLGNRTLQNCSNDVITFRDTISNVSAALTCSKSKLYHTSQVVFESSSSSIEVHFTSDNYLEGRGFQLYYTGITSCENQTFHGQSGSIFSWNFPNNYPNDQSCFYTFDSDDNVDADTLEMSFQYFHTESDAKGRPLRDGLCVTDYVEILSGDDVIKMCGDYKGKEHLLAFRGLPLPVRLRFVSNDQTTFTGFHFTWKLVNGTNTTCLPTKFNTSDAWFEINFHPQNWSDGEVDCQSKGGHLARIDDVATHELIEFYLEESQCQHKGSFWIGANDLQWESDFYWTSGGKVSYTNWFSGWTQHNAYRKQPSDDGLSDEDCVEMRKNFHLPWKGTQDAAGYFWNDRLCNVKNPYICQIERKGRSRTSSNSSKSCNTLLSLTYNDSDIVFSSPGYPNNYNNFLTCMISIESPPGTGILLNFDDFVVEGASKGGHCEYDMVEMTSSNPDSKLWGGRGRICGDWTNKIKLLHHVALTNVIQLTLTSDHSLTFRGFSGKASVLNGSDFCGENTWILVNGKCLLFNHYQASYSDASRACASLTSSLGNVAETGQASLTSLINSVRSVSSESDKSLRVWMPKNNTDDFKCQTAVIKTTSVFSDLTELSTFFSSIQDVNCDDLQLFICTKDALHSETKLPWIHQIEKPGNLFLSDFLGKATYPNNVNMNWHIYAPEGHRILITIDSLDIEDQPECLYDYLQFLHSSTTERFCGSYANTSKENSSLFTHSNDNVAIVRFISDFSVTGSGFSLSWIWLDMKLCHQELIVNASKVPFQNINFPNPHPPQVECSLTFRTLDESERIVLVYDYIQPLSLFDHMSISYLEDGEETILNSSLYHFNENPVFISDSGYLKVTYKFPQMIGLLMGFQGHYFSETGHLYMPNRNIDMMEHSLVHVYNINYPEPLSYNITQEITVRVPIGYNVILDIAKLNISDFSDGSSITVDDVSLDTNKSFFFWDLLNNGDEGIRQDAENQPENSFDVTTSKMEDFLKQSENYFYENASKSEREKMQQTERVKRDTFSDIGIRDFSKRAERNHTIKSFLNRVRLTITSGMDAEHRMQIHFVLQAVADPDFLEKTSQIQDGNFDSCKEEPCLNEGKCRTTSDVSAKCDCTPEYTGLFCQSPWCSIEPCLHGWCNTTSSGYICTCQDGFWGQNCDLDASGCSKTVCNGGGDCLPFNTTHPECRCFEDRTGLMCAEKLDDSGQETTLAQRLLKEPIWIGLIVILSVILLFGILYIIRRKCGKYFNCCEIKKPKAPDDNILNADGTITLNSFPLRKIARPPALTSISASPSPPRILLSEVATPRSSTALNNEGAAARFFASYKEAERSPIAPTLTTDFSKTTDTSLSQDAGDSSIGAMVGGRVLFDLHIRENREQQEAMHRTHSLLKPTHKVREKIKRSHSTGPYLLRQENHCGEFSPSPGPRERRVTINDVEHIYPNVIVHAPNDEEQQSDDEFHSIRTSTQDLSNNRYVDPSGAHVIEVNLEGDSEGIEGDFVNDTKMLPSYDVPAWKQHHSHSADSVFYLEQEDVRGEYIDKEKEKLKLYNEVLQEWRDKARQRYRLAKLAAQREKDEYYSLRRQDAYDRKHKSRSTPCIHHRQNPSAHHLRRIHTAEEDPVYLSDISRRRERFSGKSPRIFSSLEELDYENYQRHHKPSSKRHKSGDSYSSCECPVCAFNRSGSLTSDVSSVSKSFLSSRDKPQRYGSFRERKKMDRENYRSASATSDQSKHSRRHRRHEATSSYKQNTKRQRYSPSIRSVRSLQLMSSSTDSDLIKRNSRSSRFQKRVAQKQVGSSLSDVGQQTQAAVKAVAPAIHITEAPLVVGEKEEGDKDIFRKVFSQEIELDDFSPCGEDDVDLIWQSKLSSKESFLGSDPINNYSHFPESNNSKGNHDVDFHHVVNTEFDEKTNLEDDLAMQPPSLETRRRNSVVTVKTGSFEGIPVSMKTSLDKQNTRDTTTSSGSPGTPMKCTVIVYDSNKSLDNQDTPPTIKSRFLLSRKHSSLDLTEPLRLLQPNQQVLRNASSMQELSNGPLNESSDFDDDEKNSGSVEENIPLNKKLSTSSISYIDESFKNGPLPRTKSPRPDTIGIKLPEYVENTPPEKSANHVSPTTMSSLSSSENVSPQQVRNSIETSTKGSIQYLSVTDTDSAMSSGPSPLTTPATYRTVLSCDRTSIEPKVKDSAYQTKQSSMETEAIMDARLRRPVATIREEDRKVTQRLHQAAVKLLVMQQRLRRARQNMSKDSAVHTISEDDATLDDIIVTSSNGRTFKPGVLYPATHQEDERISEFPPLQCASIVEEQDAMVEYEV